MMWAIMVSLLTTPIDQPAAQDAELVRTHNPTDWVGWALADLATLPAEDRPFMRYIVLPPWAEADWHYAVAFAVNTACSESEIVRRPTVLPNGYVSRWDLRDLQPEDAGLVRLLKTWDQFQANEPYFHANVNGVVGIAPHIANTHLDALNALSPPPAFVLRADWFIAQSLSTIEGGLYLELAGMAGDRQKGERATAEANILARAGIFEDFSERKRGDRRVGMFRSGVTGKPRSVVVLRGFVGSAWATEDIFDEDDSAELHPIYNLVDAKFRGREIIWEKPNGFHGFLLTDDRGNVLREAPPNLAVDHQIPPPNTDRLQAGPISCVRCHGVDGGLRDAPNDVARLLSGPLEVFGQFDDPDGQREDIDRIAGLYSGRDFERLLRRGREDYAAAIDELTEGNLTVQELSQLVSDIYGQWRYEMITADTVLREAGFEIRGNAAVGDLLPALLGVAHDSRVDPAAAAVLQGISIRRADFDRIYADVMRDIARTNYEWKNNE